MKLPNPLPNSFILGALVVATVIIPFVVIQAQNQQTLLQNAWQVGQTALASCPQAGGAIITVSFSNAEPRKSSTAMTVTAVDQQTGNSINLGSIDGGQTKTGQITTDKQTLTAGSVQFNLRWTDGHSGTDMRTANYNAVKNCQKPTPTPTPLSSPTPSSPTPPYTPLTPSPTICPTLGPVKNVHIKCPNCL